MLPTVHYNMGGIPTNYLGEVIKPTKEDPNRVRTACAAELHFNLYINLRVDELQLEAK